MTIKHEQSGKWFAFVVSDEKKSIVQQPITKVVGIDVGLDNFVYDSDGHVVKNPRHLKKNEVKLAKLQRKLSTKKKGSKNRNKCRIQVACRHEKIKNIRTDFLHKISYYYTTQYDVIGMEDMPMTLKKDMFSKSRQDASWGRLRQFMAYKAASAGKLLIPVATKGTTQRCSQCQTIVPKELWQRTHECSNCGFTAARDYNSALEIKRLTLKEIGWGTAESTLVEMGQVVPSMKQEAPLF